MGTFWHQAFYAMESGPSSVYVLSPPFAWQTQDTPNPGHTAHLGHPAPSTSRCPALLQEPCQGGGKALGTPDQHKCTFWAFQRWKDFLNERHVFWTWDLAKQQGCWLSVWHAALLGQLCAVSPYALPWSLCHQAGDSRSFSHGSLEAAVASDINFP